VHFSDILFEKWGFDGQKFTSTAEFSARRLEKSAVLAKNSTSTADFSAFFPE
jgi:hypothetical protein